MKAAVAEPFGDAEGEQQSSEWKTHECDNECEPTGIGAGAGGAESAEQGLKQDRGEYSRAHHGRAPLQKLAGAVA